MIVDADAHINENPLEWTGLERAHPGWLTAARSGGRTVAGIDGKPYPRQEGPGCGVPIESSILPAARAGALDLDRRIVDMDSEGIEIQVLYGGLSIGVTGFSDPGFADDFARAYNDWLLDDVCGRYPDRLVGVCTVPLQDPSRAVRELQRVAGKGARAVTIPPVVGDRNLDDAGFLDFFAATEELGLAVGVHSAPGMNLPLPAADRFANYAQVHLLSFPVDQMVAFTALALGGVLDRFPRLRVAFLEAGVGWAPFFLARAKEHRDKRGELVPGMTSDPRDYLERGQCWFSFECEDTLVPHFVETFGPDSLLFASDYPHWDADFPGTVEEARGLLQPLGDEVTRKALGDNAVRFYALESMVSAASSSSA